MRVRAPLRFLVCDKKADFVEENAWKSNTEDNQGDHGQKIRLASHQELLVGVRNAP